MDRRDRTTQRLIALSLLGWVLLTAPLLPLLGNGERMFGVPALYAYIFLIWAGLIALLALLTRR